MGDIVVKVPAQHKGLADAMKETVAAVANFERLARERDEVKYREHERLVADLTAQIEREAHAASLRALDIDAERLRIDGVEHRKVGRHSAQYKTRVGPVAVERALYRKVGERNARTVNTVTLRSGAVLDEWLPGAAAAMAHRIAVGTSREAAAASVVERTLPYSRSSFERVGHEVGRQCVDKRVEIEELLAAEFSLPAGAASVSASVDRVSVPMEEPRPHPPGRPKKDAPKRPIKVVYRMAYCATLTIHDAKGQALHTIRYGRMPKGDPESLVEAIASDALSLRNRQRSLRVVALGDGAHEVWNLLNRHVDDKSFGDVHRLVDFWHVVEKLAPAAKVIAGAQDKCTRLIARWRANLANRENAADAILAELRRSNCEHVVVGDSAPVHEAITYLKNHRKRMNYARARQLGLPIGSGNVEASCKSLFALRLKRPGARWHDDTGEEVVTLRAHQLSDRWQRAVEHALAPADVEFSRVA